MKRIIASLAILLVIGLVPARPAAADDEYRVQDETYFPVHNRGYPNGTCQGYVFIGQTWSGTIEAYNYVLCGYTAPVLGATLQGVEDADRVCDEASYCDVTFSTGGQYGREYCVLGSNTVYTGILRQGAGWACINT